MVDPKRAGRYQRAYAQLQELIEGKSPDLVAAMATVCAVLHHKMPHHFWTGFYFTGPTGELHVGPYQGPVACQILEETGVCLECARTKQPVVVPDVSQFPGHIACDPRSKSELALPLIAPTSSKRAGEVVAVFDVDASRLHQFDNDDVGPLERILSLLAPYL